MTPEQTPSDAAGLTPERYRRVRALYLAACELIEPARGELLTRECGADGELRAEVQSLLQHHAETDDGLDDSQIGLGARLLEAGAPASGDFGGLDAHVSVTNSRPAEAGDATASRTPPETIGRYRLLRRIGEGGMGSVFEAQQETPVRRRVALKIIKPGMDTRQVVRRFEQERQALALMDHPHIARVFDAGATPTGRPFFVMELCAGESITAYCDDKKLSIRDRLALFAQVCDAVQHAHQKGVIHRDLKPSNILVSDEATERRSDGGKSGAPGSPPSVASSLRRSVAIPKIIDFGIAKATTERLTDITFVTEQRQFVGTPEYMSPEQAEGSRDIDTRTDVYSLGVLLYELLTGLTPFNSRDLPSYVEMQRVIREVDPPLPSVRVKIATKRRSDGATQGKKGAEPAAPLPPSAPSSLRRSVAPSLLPSRARTLRGELDSIVMKALEKDRRRRYEAAGALGADIRRYLAGDVVLAAPPSASYRVRKFVQRNRALVIGGSVVAVALVAGLAGTLWQAGVARRETATARARAAELKQVAEFQARILGQIDATEAGQKLLENLREKHGAALAKQNLSPEQRARQAEAFDEQLAGVSATDVAADLIDATILKPAAESLAAFADQPTVDAALRQTLADIYRSLGRFADARPLQERALAIRQNLLGAGHPDTLASTHAMGMLLRMEGRQSEVQPLMRSALETARRAVGDDDPIVASLLTVLGASLRQQGRLEEAEVCWREALERRRRVLGPDDSATLISMNSMGSLLRSLGRPVEAEALLREALERGRRVNGEDHRQTLISLNFLGFFFFDTGQLDAAERYWTEALAKRRRVLGENHFHTLNSISNMGLLRAAQGRLEQAEALFREALEKRRHVLGENHPITLETVGSLCDVLERSNRAAEAEPLRRRVLAAIQTRKGPASVDAASVQIDLGRNLMLLGRFAEAERNLLQARKLLGADPSGQAELRRCQAALAALAEGWSAADPAGAPDVDAAGANGKLPLGNGAEPAASQPSDSTPMRQ